ncbi:MAG: transcription elongation factor Spt5 [Candidatus Lokiarchaeia archaeon]
MSKKTSIFALRTTIGQEKSVATLIEKRMEGNPEANIKAILAPESLNGYVFIEAPSQREVNIIITGIPHVRGKVVGKIDIDELNDFLIPKPPTEGINRGDIVEITGGPFKGERAKVTRIDPDKGEVVLELIETQFLIPVKVHADYVKLVEKGEGEEEVEGEKM